MSLTVGSAPFSRRPGGVFNFRREGPAGVLYLEGSSRRVRALLAGETVLDSRRVMLLHESDRLPVYLFPAEDVRQDLLEPSTLVTPSALKGDRSHWSVRVGDRVAADAVWGHPHPPAGAEALAGHLGVTWNAMDSWWEEDQEVFVHAKDPYHRVDVLPTSRHVRVSLEGQTLAETRRAQMLLETGLPVRWYLPPEDVRRELLMPIPFTSACPYKGHASYHSVRVGGREHRGLVWSYPDPLPEIRAVIDHLCFFDERVDLDVDGERQERPRTPWSDADWATRTGEDKHF